MKLTIDNMTIEGTVEECYEFQVKIKTQKEKDRIELVESMKKERAGLIPTYQPPTYIGTPFIPTPVTPYEPNRIWWHERGDILTYNDYGEIISWEKPRINGFVNASKYGEWI